MINIGKLINMSFLLLFLQIVVPIAASLQHNFSQFLHTPKQYCANNSCIYIDCPELTLTVNYPVNISFSFTFHNDVDFINLFFESGPQLKSIENRSLLAVLNDTENVTVELDPVKLGHTVLHIYAVPITNLTTIIEGFIIINVRKSMTLMYFGEIIGWLYFLSWSISFYPQIVLNYRRKSVVGLHFDFLSLNFVGFFLYTIFNIGLYWIPTIQDDYFDKHPFSVIPVQINDVLFSIHAFLACVLLVFQCLIYDKGDQVISKTAQSIVGGISTASIVFLILAFINAITWLGYLYILSYMKLFITLIKYIPQAYYNHLRRSTTGWSIGNILLDFTGGLLSILQMFILSYNFNDWNSIFGDPTKFGLGIFSMLFDILFIIQHYVLFRNYNNYEEILDHSVESNSSNLNNSDATNSYVSSGTK